VTKGAIIAELASPELLKDIELAELGVERVSQQLNRAAADEMNRAQSLVLNRDLLSLKARLAGLREEQQELTVRAPFDGVVAQMGVNIHAGRWLGKNDLIALVVSPAGLIARGYVSEANLPRVSEQTSGRFVPDDLTRGTFPLRVTSIARTGASQIEISELSSNHEGPIAVMQDGRRQFRPSAAQYEIQMEPVGNVPPPEFRVRGLVELRGSGESMAAKLWRRTVQVLVRESGF
jgi:putative peptide zinc metalloprotease protein